jgi:hypothetical protein
MGLLSLFGLGQSDLENVFNQTIDAAKAIDTRLTQAHRDGFALAVSAMLDVLKKEDVLNDSTHKKLMETLKQWHRTE